MVDLYANHLDVQPKQDAPAVLIAAAEPSSSASLATASAQQAIANLTGVNLALHRPGFSSSQEGDANGANYAFDGARSTRWASGWSDPQWIYVDLGASYSINKVVLRWEAYAKSYEIQISDDTKQWRTLFATVQGKGDTEAINLNGVGRFVRVYMKSRATEYGNSLFEFEVYGGGQNSPSAQQSLPKKNLIDMAEGKPATASSAESDVWSARHAVDGSSFSRWSSGFSDNEWITVDLQKVETISRVVLKWESAYARAYKLQVSDDNKTWKDIYSTTAGDGDVDDIPVNATGRYVRMQGIVRATEYGYSLWGFEIY